jgi:hypothetical protein
MKGIARTVIQLIYGSGLQRWLVRIGLCLTILGFGALKSGWYPGAQPLFAFTGILAAGITVVSPVVVGAIMFRALSAPRSVQLIPHGRLKLLLGALSTQVLLALFMAACMTTQLMDGPGAHASLLGATTASGFMAVIIAYAFSALTFIFLNFYFAMQSRLGALVWVAYIFAPQLLSHAFPQLHLGARLVTQEGMITVLSASALAWPVFALSYIRRRHINVIQDWKLLGLGASPLAGAAPRHRSLARATSDGTPKRYGQQQAVRILLTGTTSVRQRLFSTGIISAFFLIAMLTITSGNVSDRSAFVWAFMACVFAGITPTFQMRLKSLRAKSLWLTARMGREDLFTTLEKQSWNTLLPLAGTAMALGTALLMAKMHGAPPPAQLVSILAVPLTIGASWIYIGMLLVRGRRLLDTALLAGYTVLLMVELFSAVLESPTSALPSLLGANIIALPLLRLIAQRRWQNIDWLIHKRSATQLTG